MGPVLAFTMARIMKRVGTCWTSRAALVLVPVLHLLPGSAYQHLGLRGFRHAAPYVKEQAVGWLHRGPVCRQGNLIGVWDL